MLNEAQVSKFRADGIIHCPGLQPIANLIGARQLIFDTLRKESLSDDAERWTGGCLTEAEAARVRKRVSDRCKKSQPFVELISRPISEVVSQLAAPTTQLLAYSQLLFTAPTKTPWTIPTKLWHLDAPRLKDGACPGVQMFVLLGDIESQGGGTLMVSGSHHFLNDQGFLPSKKVKQNLSHLPWFHKLLKTGEMGATAMEPQTINGIDCRVVELTGQAGDVFFTDLRLLHTLAPNNREQPRLMATQRFVKTEYLTEIYGPGASNQH